MPDNVIKIKDLNKNFGKVCAVSNLSFEVQANTCFGFLGPNGAGKTTVMKMLYGKCFRERYDKDSVNVFGYDPAKNELEIKSQSGVVQQEDNLDDELNVFQNLWLYSKFYNLGRKTANERIAYLLGFFDLNDKKKSRIRELSGGMKRRLVIARALLNDPKLLILDEPTTGLDPQVRHLIWDKLRQLKKQNTTILLTTHYMEEAFQLCDSILIMHKGKKVMQGTPQQLLEKNIEKYVLELIDVDTGRILKENGTLDNLRIDKSSQVTRVYSNETENLKVLANQLEGTQYYLRQANLEDVFLKATGRELNE
jgi:lipooligosaccharide transport system ATP-binding protein